MCLQWCHVLAWLIDNDIPCSDCLLAAGPAHAASHTCATCRHQQIAAEGPICGLSRARLPVAGWCCHRDAPLDAPATIPLGAVTVAPWVLDAWRVNDAAALLAVHPNEITPRDALDGPVLALADLALPLVYGVVSADWDTARGGVASAWETGPVDMLPAHLDALIALYDAQQAGDPQRVAPAQAAVAALLAREPLDSLAEPWRSELGNLWAMMRNLAQSDASSG